MQCAVLDDDTAVPCNGRFEYDTSSGSIYSFITEWQPGLTSGEAFEAELPGLLPGIRYCFRTQARNSGGTAEGNEMLSLTTPLPPESLSAPLRYLKGHVVAGERPPRNSHHGLPQE